MRRRFVDSSGAIIGEVSGGESAGSPGIKVGAGGGGGQCDLRGGGGANTSYVPTSVAGNGGGDGGGYNRDAVPPGAHTEAEWAQITTNERLQRIEALLLSIASHLGIAGACDVVETTGGYGGSREPS